MAPPSSLTRLTLQQLREIELVACIPPGSCHRFAVEYAWQVFTAPELAVHQIASPLRRTAPFSPKRLHAIPTGPWAANSTRRAPCGAPPSRPHDGRSLGMTEGSRGSHRRNSTTSIGRTPRTSSCTQDSRLQSSTSVPSGMQGTRRRGDRTGMQLAGRVGAEVAVSSYQASRGPRSASSLLRVWPISVDRCRLAKGSLFAGPVASRCAYIGSANRDQSPVGELIAVLPLAGDGDDVRCPSRLAVSQSECLLTAP